MNILNIFRSTKETRPTKQRSEDEMMPQEEGIRGNTSEDFLRPTGNKEGGENGARTRPLNYTEVYFPTQDSDSQP